MLTAVVAGAEVAEEEGAAAVEVVAVEVAGALMVGVARAPRCTRVLTCNAFVR